MNNKPGQAGDLHGRLAGFEDDGDDKPELTLPPRPRRKVIAQDAPGQASPSRATLMGEAPPTAGPAPDPIEKPATSPRTSTGQLSTVPASIAAEKQPAPDSVRPSNAQVPVDVLAAVGEYCTKHGTSRGDLIVIAIEATYDKLDSLIHPQTTGGNLFSKRRGKAARAPEDGPLTPLNYRMREDDFETLDRLVDELGAASRGHLITVALRAYLNSEPQ